MLLSLSCRWAGYMQGYDVEIATDAVWSGKTTANFASYQAIVFGDGRFTDTVTPTGGPDPGTLRQTNSCTFQTSPLQGLSALNLTTPTRLANGVT